MEKSEITLNTSKHYQLKEAKHHKAVSYIADAGSDVLIAIHKGEQISDAAAVAIAQAAPNNAKLQAVGIRYVMDGKSIKYAVNIMHALKLMADEARSKA